MPIVRCEYCDTYIDLDYNTEVECIDGEFYHWQCAADAEKVEEDAIVPRSEYSKN